LKISQPNQPNCLLKTMDINLVYYLDVFFLNSNF